MYFALLAIVYTIPISWNNFWEGFGHVNEVIMPFAIMTATMLPYFLNTEGYRLDDKQKKLIVASGGKTYIDKINGRKFEFVEDPFGGIIRRDLRNGKYWFTYKIIDYYYDNDFKLWVNPDTYMSFDDEYPEVAKEAKERKNVLLRKLAEKRKQQQEELDKQKLDGKQESTKIKHKRTFDKQKETGQDTSLLTWYIEEKENEHKSTARLNVNWPLILHPIDDIPWWRLIPKKKTPAIVV